MKRCRLPYENMKLILFIILSLNVEIWIFDYFRYLPFICASYGRGATVYFLHFVQKKLIRIRYILLILFIYTCLLFIYRCVFYILTDSSTYQFYAENSILSLVIYISCIVKRHINLTIRTKLRLFRLVFSSYIILFSCKKNSC